MKCDGDSGLSSPRMVATYIAEVKKGSHLLMAMEKKFNIISIFTR